PGAASSALTFRRVGRPRPRLPDGPAAWADPCSCPSSLVPLALLRIAGEKDTAVQSGTPVAGWWTRGVRPVTLGHGPDGPNPWRTFAVAPGSHPPVRARAVALARRLPAWCRRALPEIETHWAQLIPSPPLLGSDTMRMQTTVAAVALLAVGTLLG